MPLVDTFTGRQVDPLDLRVDDVCIEDIAHHLSQEPRFGGAPKRFYSVAEHSLHVAQCARGKGGDADMVFTALFHDASETYLRDIPKPLKYDPLFDAYRVVEARVMDTISLALGFLWPKPPLVQEADDALLWIEGSVLLKYKTRNWPGYETTGAPIIESRLGRVFAGVIRQTCDPEIWRARFLNLHESLSTKLGERRRT